MDIQPIGHIRSSFSASVGTPIQPRFAGESPGEAVILPEYADGLADLDGFDRIWLIFWCHRACAARMRVVPYRDTVERGIFATRAPARPNAIGLSCVGLAGIEGNTLQLSEVDILDGTPLLDIKPYVPEYDAYQIERTGWIGKSALSIRKADARFEKALA